jgi:hypothetical protein
MKRWRLLRVGLLAFATLAITRDSSTAEENRPFLGGAGATRCEKWLETRKDKASVLELALEAWVMGFVSGASSVIDAPAGFLTGTTEDDVLNRLDNHCRAHPSDPLISAMLLITADLMTAHAAQIRKNPKQPAK